MNQNNPLLFDYEAASPLAPFQKNCSSPSGPPQSWPDDSNHPGV